MLGFKDLRQTIGTASLNTLYSRGILSTIHHAAAGRGKLDTVNGMHGFYPDWNENSVDFRFFSDTVFLFTENDSITSFINLIRSANSLLAASLSGFKCPFRGAITKGDLINNPNGILIGKAIEEAYLAEQSQAWAGVMLTDECEKFIESKNYLSAYSQAFLYVAENESDPYKKARAKNFSAFIKRYPTPIQKRDNSGNKSYSTKESYVLDWTLLTTASADSAFQDKSDSHVSTLRDNTIAFEKWAISLRTSGTLGI
ncbi:MAG: hypothetical protein JWR07_475 [Nevskia sp.]|nr:hypothetical protein [Nevskia sp.]